MDDFRPLTTCRSVLRMTCVAAISFGLMTVSPAAPQAGPELKKFQGDWEVVQLVENGNAVAAERIREILPSGGRVRVIESAIIFRSPKDKQQHAKMFKIEPTTYPSTIDVGDSDGKTSRGIYQFDQGRLVICFADPDTDGRPDAFSAGADSQRMMMVLKRPSVTSKPQQVKPGQPNPIKRSVPAPAALKGLTDSDIAKSVVGTWVLKDNAGSLYVTFRSDRTFSTVREYQELRLFHKSFVQTPISQGTWNVKNALLSSYVGSSTDVSKVNRIFSFSIRSISSTDMIFVDPMGRVVRSTRLLK